MPRLVQTFVAAAVSAAAVSSVSAGLVIDETLPRVVINSDEYTATPNGYILSHCVYEVPHNAESKRDESTGLITVTAAPEDGGHKLGDIAPCKPIVDPSNPVLTTHSLGVNGKPARADKRRQLQLPPDYNGWLQYTAFYNETGFDVFTSVMSVPDVPKSEPQILYLFPGLQNIDWIPKVDPMPSQAFDIIQPVLQYPYFSSDSNGKEWGLRSWYVTVTHGALMSHEIPIAPGDSVICNMTRLGDDEWFIGSKISSTGKETNQKASAATLETQPWAYNTVECYGCDGCDTYPDNEFSISECEISSFEHGAADIEWESNPKPAKDLLCNEKTTIESAQVVKFDFQ